MLASELPELFWVSETKTTVLPLAPLGPVVGPSQAPPPGAVAAATSAFMRSRKPASAKAGAASATIVTAAAPSNRAPRRLKRAVRFITIVLLRIWPAPVPPRGRLLTPQDFLRRAA